MTQLALTLPSPEPRALTLAEHWQLFHQQNPDVWRKFEAFTFDVIRAGKTRAGAKAVWERMRWWADVESNDPDFKLNNNYTAYYARHFMQVHPEHAGIFLTRGGD